MGKDKFALFLFLIGMVCERYLFPMLDIVLGLISNKYSVSTSKSQKEINDFMLASEYNHTNAIGFIHNDVDEYYDDDECQKKNKIGFTK